MDYQTMKIEEIINWCKDNNQVEWLKKTAKQLVPYKVYPTKVIVDSNGKSKKVADKSAKPKTEMRPISFIQLKKEFVEKFMPEIAPSKKDKKATFYDIIAAL